MDTEEIMELALDLAGLKKIPEDSAIYVKGRNIRKVLFGIDAGASELLLAKQMGFDAVIAHHPIGGKAAVNFHRVFLRHVDQMVRADVPRKEAQAAVSKKLGDLEVDGQTRNYGHGVDVARLLKMPYMNIHTPLDEVGRRRMQEQIDKRLNKHSTVEDGKSALEELPEFRNAVTKVKILLGKPENPAGRVVVSHGAGTNGGYEVAKTYFKYGVGTVVYIHVAPADLARLRTDSVGNLVVSGHIASDSVGINPFIRELGQKKIAITTIGVVPE